MGMEGGWGYESGDQRRVEMEEDWRLKGAGDWARDGLGIRLGMR